jgi:hypothetical protein
MDFAFQPAGAFGATPAASTSLAVTLVVQQLALPAFVGQSMRLVNNGTASIAWSFGVSANLSMTNGVVMLPNTAEMFTVPVGTTQLSVIGSAAGTSVLTASIGEGM